MEANTTQTRKPRTGIKKPVIVHPYRVMCGKERIATVYFDAHRVRTQSQTLMIAVAPDGQIVHIELLSFNEPPAYKLPEEWYAALVGRRLTPGLRLGHDVNAVTGATITSRATIRSVRRTLATHNELCGVPAKHRTDDAAAF